MAKFIKKTIITIFVIVLFFIIYIKVFDFLVYGGYLNTYDEKNNKILIEEINKLVKNNDLKRIDKSLEIDERYPLLSSISFDSTIYPDGFVINLYGDFIVEYIYYCEKCSFKEENLPENINISESKKIIKINENIYHIFYITGDSGQIILYKIKIDINFSLHEYPENNYITVDCYTCGEEGDPLAAINNLIEKLDKLVGVKKQKVKFFKRGKFEEKSANILDFNYFDISKEQKNDKQEKLNKICKSLTPEQILELQDILYFAIENKEKMVQHKIPFLKRNFSSFQFM